MKENTPAAPAGADYVSFTHTVLVFSFTYQVVMVLLQKLRQAEMVFISTRLAGVNIRSDLACRKEMILVV